MRIAKLVVLFGLLAAAITLSYEAPARAGAPIDLDNDLTVSMAGLIPCGDVNDNGEVAATDAHLVLQYAAGLILSVPLPAYADVNDDDRIDPRDAALILQFDAGLVPLIDLRCTD